MRNRAQRLGAQSRIGGCSSLNGVTRARRRPHPGCPRPVRPCGSCGEDGGKPVIVINILAAVLGIAAVIYLLTALVNPEKF